MELFSKSPIRARFEADSGKLVGAQTVSFPIDMVVRKPSHEAALTAARQLLATLEKEAVALSAGTVTVVVDHVRFDYEQKSSMLLQLTGRLTVAIQPNEFWPRTEAIAKLLDVIQKQCEPSKDRADVGVQTGLAELSASDTKPAS
jgi:hypothetical protein